MGVVYKAEDTRLGRTVALKFLSAGMKGREMALERFQREARLASALNHPHICTVYDVGEADGHFFIAMEFLEGQPLNDVLRAGALSEERIVALGMQVADALEAAHSKLVVHRDIKPANLFLTKRDTIKVVDFGLAKLTKQAAEVDAPTQTMVPLGRGSDDAGLTQVGAAVGTISYMSPEQARGEEVDARTDLFSFGVVLYLMATGELPFRGTTETMRIWALLDSAPVGPRTMNPAISVQLEEIILKCLEKDPNDRYQSARELMTDLRRLGRSMSGQSNRSMPLVSRVETGRRWGRGAWIAVALGVAAIGAGGVYLGSRSPAEAFQRVEIQHLTESGRASCAAISGDGRYVAYVEQSAGGEGIFLRQVTGSFATQVLPTEDVRYGGLEFSPDGNALYFARFPKVPGVPGAIYQMPMLGGKPQLVTQDVMSAPGFSPDGKRIAFLRKDMKLLLAHVVLANLDGTNETVLASRSMLTDGLVVGNAGRAMAPAWSPDGATIAVGAKAMHVGPLYSVSTAVLTIAVASGKTRWYQFAGHSVGRMSWRPDSRALLLTGWNLSTRELRGQLHTIDIADGKIRPLTQDLSDYTHDDLSVSANGPTLTAVVQQDFAHVWRYVGGDLGRGVELTSGNRSWRGLSELPDGRMVGADARFELAILSRDGRSVQPVVADKRLKWGPAACGNRLLFIVMDRLDRGVLFGTELDGSNPMELHAGRMGNPSCTPDGKWAVLNTPSPDERPSLYKFALGGGGRVELLRRRSFPSAVSPDGRNVAIVLEEQGNANVRHFALVPVDGLRPGEEPRIVARNVGFETGFLRWTADGGSLTYLLHRQGASNLWSQPLNGGAAKQITHFTADTIFDFFWGKNGDLVMARGPEHRDVVLIRSVSQ